MNFSILKVHYLLWFGSLSGIMPFVSIFAKEHALATAEDVGLLYFILPFIVSVMKPLFCSIADRNHSHKKILITFIVITILGYALLLTTVFVKMGRFSWYWFCFLVLLANSGQGIVISLNDYLVMKEVTELNKSYGGYRVWGTIGWGGFGVIAGLMNDYIPQLPSLLPGLLLFIVTECIDLFSIVYSFRGSNKNSENEKRENLVVVSLLPKKRSVRQIVAMPFLSTHKSLKQILSIYRNHPSLIQYTAVVLVSGSLTAFHWSYYFWYLELIRGKDGLLFGLALAVQSFLGELPIFIIADRILKFCGPSMSLNISLAAFALRYFIYGYVFTTGNSYWDILLVEVVQGLTFGLFYTAMTSLAQFYATEDRNRSQMAVKSVRENEQIDTVETHENVSPRYDSYATLQGIMSGAFEGIGLGVGALVGGYVIERVNVFYIWKVGAFMALATIVFNVTIEIIKYFYVKNKNKTNSAVNRTDIQI